jgi:hypothetical protein
MAGEEPDDTAEREAEEQEEPSEDRETAGASA